MGTDRKRDHSKKLYLGPCHLPLSRLPTVRSTPLVEGEGCDHGKNREANSFGGDTESGDDESQSSGEGVEMLTSEVDDTEVENTLPVSGKAVSTTSRAGSSAHSGTSFDSKGRRAFGEGLADAPATFDSFSHGPDRSLLHCATGIQRDMLSTSRDRYARLFSKDVHVLERDSRKTLPKQAWYPRRTS